MDFRHYRYFCIRCSGLLLLGIVLLAAGVVFQIVTLPVEFDASKRAMNEVVSLGIIGNNEEAGRT